MGNDFKMISKLSNYLRKMRRPNKPKKEANYPRNLKFVSKFAPTSTLDELFNMSAAVDGWGYTVG